MRRWNVRDLTERLGQVEIQFKISTTNKHPNFHETELGKAFARGSARFGEFLQAITEGSAEERAKRLFTGDEQFLVRRRNGETTVNSALEPLWRDVEVPSFMPRDRLYTVWAWFSGPGVRTWLHYDNNGCHNLNAQISGNKEAVLFSPDDLVDLAPFPLGGRNPAHNCSQIDVDAPDLTRFPNFDRLRSWRAKLGPGDLLFIPAWWSHSFRHLGDFNSNINFWWKPERPMMNATANRQALLDAVAAAKVEAPPGSSERALLGRLDEAVLRRA
jgi:lysine-specific demethylase 8